MLVTFSVKSFWC